MQQFDYQLKILGKNIKSQRKAKRLTIKELADVADISVASLSALENGRIKNPSLLLLNNIATALNVELQTLLPKKEDDEQFLKEELIDTYYPPADVNEISSMLELVLILPFIEPDILCDLLSRIRGDVHKDEKYISHLFSHYWKCFVPRSKAKCYAQNELYRIRKIREGKPYDLTEIKIDVNS